MRRKWRRHGWPVCCWRCCICCCVRCSSSCCLPLTAWTFGLVGLLLDAGFVLLADRWMDGFAVDGFLWALAASLMTNFLREGAGMLAGKKR